MALGYFKVAIIAAGIAFRARMGGGVAADTDAVDQAVAPLIAEGSARSRLGCEALRPEVLLRCAA